MKRIPTFCAGVLMACLPHVAAAGTITTTLLLDIPGLGPLTQQFSSSGPVAPVNGGFGLQIQGNVLPLGSLTFTIPSTAAPPFTEFVLRMDGNPAPVTFTAFGPPDAEACPNVAPRRACVQQIGWGGALPVQGAWEVRAFGGLTLGSVPFTSAGAGLGIGGTAAVNLYGLNVAVQGAPWTDRTAVVTPTLLPQTTTMGVPVALPLGAGSSVVVVTGGLLSVDDPISIPVLMTMEIELPEPAPLALAVLASAALGIFGRRRGRRVPGRSGRR